MESASRSDAASVGPEIARELPVSRLTVKSHVHNVCRKPAVNNRLEAARILLESKLFGTPYNWM